MMIRNSSSLPLFKGGSRRCLFLWVAVLLVGSPLLSVGAAAEASTGPFQSGCLYASKPEWKKKRVCNSEDSQEAIQNGVCRVPKIQYEEIRIFAPNWESGFLQSWMLQIILSELLDIPTTLETGTPDAYINFYDPQERVEYGASLYDTASLENAHNQPNGDCTLVKTIAGGGVDYVPCSHYLPEIWHSNNDFSQEQARAGIIEPQEGTGLLGYEGWFVPKFTGQQDPSLLNYLGLAGEHNRHKVAKAFQTPTTWLDYCERIANNGCRTPDSTAQRPPKGEDEYDKFFVDGVYSGHFRVTEQNNCTLNPTNCTGHIADFPCDWTSFTIGQLHHLGIALEGGKGKAGTTNGIHSYSYSELIQLWLAANATKSNLMMMWWSPELLYQQFQNTDAEFVPVGMPSSTQECFENRIKPEDRCSDDPKVRVGSPLGVCGEAARPLTKKIASILAETIYNPDIPEAIRSPGHEVLDDFTLSNTQLDEAFKKWFSEPTPRHAVCEWVIENMDHMERFVPKTHPRTLEVAQNDGLIYAATILGAVTALLVGVTAFGVQKYRDEQVMKFAQVNFLFILLAGSMLISIGAIVLGSPSTDATCVAAIWFINVGYTLELVPLLIKISAINRLLSAAQKMRRLRVNRTSLYGGVLVINVFVIVFLILWTSLDPPQIQQEYILTENLNEDNETIVSNAEYCSSESPIWSYVAVGWNALLLLMATVLAFQARRLSSPYNESGTLGILIYSHFVFVLLRIVTFFLSSNVRASVLEAARSILFSVDTMATIFIYFLPKFAFNNNNQGGVAGNREPSQGGFSRLFLSSRFFDGNPTSGGSPTTDVSKRGWLISRIISNITMVSQWGNDEKHTKDEGSWEDSPTDEGTASPASGGSPATANDITDSSRQAVSSYREKSKRVEFAPSEDASAVSYKTAISPPDSEKPELQGPSVAAPSVMPGDSEIELQATIDDQNEKIRSLQTRNDSLHEELQNLREMLLKPEMSTATTSVVEA